MTEPHDGFAYPHYFPSDDGCGSACEGMSLRDFFAAQDMKIALGGVLEELKNDQPVALRRVEMFAELSYAIADAMLKARKQNR